MSKNEKKVGQTSMALNALWCNYLTPLGVKGLNVGDISVDHMLV